MTNERPPILGPLAILFLFFLTDKLLKDVKELKSELEMVKTSILELKQSPKSAPANPVALVDDSE